MEEGLQRVRIKKIGVLSLATTFGLLGVVIGLIFGLIFLLVPSIGSGIQISGISTSTLSLINAITGYWAILVLPISYGIIMFVQGAIIALLYNLVAKVSKGVALYS